MVSFVVISQFRLLSAIIFFLCWCCCLFAFILIIVSFSSQFSLNSASQAFREKDLDAKETEELLDALNRNTLVKTVNLWRNSLGYLGAMALSDFLATNNNIVSLNLENNNIDSSGAKLIAMALKKNDTHYPPDTGQPSLLRFARKRKTSETLSILTLFRKEATFSTGQSPPKHWSCVNS